VKAIGDGLSAPLERFDVTLAPDEPARLTAIDGDPARARCWTLAGLRVPAGYAAALAVEGPASIVELDACAA
jgi:4'-phosphopantetheinyl transferase